MRTLFIITITAALLSGCVLVEHKPSSVPYGTSVRTAISSQTLNHQPPTDAPVNEMDGVYAEKVMEKYHKGPQTKPSGSSIFNLILGGGK
ncbi:MAG: hypothetical protein ACNI27_13415 [Desulfovibrio sp.]